MRRISSAKLETGFALRRIALVGAILALSGCTTPAPWNVLVVTFDTTRADALGCYGNPDRPTPTLDSLAAEGVLFEHAVTAVPITTPSHSTIHTGTYPILHGVRDNGRFVLPKERVTLAEILRQHGYSTGAAVGAFPLRRSWGLDQGFDFYDDHITIAGEDEQGRRRAEFRMFFDERPATRVNEAILPFLRGKAEEPFFVWVHYWDPHQPYLAPPPFSELFAQDPYEAELAYADRALGVLLDELKRAGRFDRTLIVALADHGEGHGEHGEDTHSMLLYEGTVHVPLIVRYPGGPKGARVRERVGTVDVLPTILDLLGIEAPAEVQGRSLIGAMRTIDPTPGNRRPYYAETLSPRLSYSWGELRALYLENWKLIYGPNIELFDLGEDPREIANRSPADPSERLTGALQTFIQRNSSASANAAVNEADDETRQRLAALGYLSASAGPIEVVETLRQEGDPPQVHVSMVGLWSQCKRSLQNGDFLAAEEQSARLVEEEPGNSFYLALRVASLLGLGRLDEAAGLAESGSIRNANVEIFLSIVTRLFHSGQETRARALIDRIVEQFPNAMAYYLRGEMRGELGDGAGRESDLRAALAEDPKLARARQSLAILLAESGRAAQAETEFRTLVAERPIDAAIRLNYATFLISAGRYPEAEAQLRRALEIAPDYRKAQLALLTVLSATGREDEAIALRGRIERGAGGADGTSQSRGSGTSR